jgi:serine phosphatase RsbU (regulator of sigma subunit)/anti-anti-sigma regulatory factor
MDAQTPTILVVDDDPVIRRLVAREVERLECGEVCEAPNGLEAKRLLETADFDLVITDVVMPQLDGLGLMRWAQEKRPDSAWIILSGLDTFDAAVEAIQLGAFDFLAKPPQIERLRVAVRNALERRELVRERRKLVLELEQSNLDLSLKVDQLEKVCRVLAEQAEVIQRDLERAEVIQRALLPLDPPPLGGFRVETLYRPGRNVGGDLYDVAALDTRHVVLLIADASGHGVSAAMLSVLFKHHLRMIDPVTGAPVPPADALAQVNAALVSGVTAPGMFITAAYGLLDTEQGEVRLASAGHPPVLCQRRSGEVEAIERNGPALGVDPEAEFAEARVRLERGDRLLLFTDGMLGADAATDRVRERLAGGGTVRETLDALLVGSETGVAVDDRDDVTAILLEARVGPSRFDDAVHRMEETRAQPAKARSEITVGETSTATWVRVVGRGTWTSAEPFYAYARAALQRGQTLALDFSACDHLDSTFLGTIHELVRVGRDAGVEVCLQALPAALRGCFEELSMRLVLGCVQETEAPPPTEWTPLPRKKLSDPLTQQRLLRAHETLASLSEQNREEFRGVIESLRAELRAATNGR